VDRLVEMLQRIVRKEYAGTYAQNSATGAFTAAGFHPDFARRLPLSAAMLPAIEREVSEAS
jgi:hypothetical protein